MKKLFSFLSLVLIVFLLVGCAQPTDPDFTATIAIPPKDEPTSSAAIPSEEEIASSAASSETVSEQSTSSEEESSSASEPSTEPTSEPSEQSDVKNIIFIGNSLTNCGKMPEHLERIGKGRYNVTNACIDGSELKTHIERFSDEEYYYREALSEADIVVFQEFGGYMDELTEEALKELVKMCREICGPDTKYYFMMFEFFGRYPDIREECLDMLSECGVEPLPIGEIISYVRDTYFSEDQFILSDGLHPTQLQGNIMAMAFIIIEEDESCTDGDWAGSDSKLNRTYPDKTEDEINEEMKKIQKDAYNRYQKVKGNYFR